MSLLTLLFEMKATIESEMLTLPSRETAKSSSLGPQCFTCKKRQVKCDSAYPTCQRCTRDGIRCRGYKKDLRIIHYDRSTKHKPRNKANRGDWKDIPSPPLRAMLVDDKDTLVALDCLHYLDVFCNTKTVPVNPSIVPRDFLNDAPIAQESPSGAIFSEVLPKVSRYAFIVQMRSIQAHKRGADPSSEADICHYRGLGLSELKRTLPKAVEDSSGIILACIIMFLSADLQFSNGYTWHAHLKAARKIIMLKGGVQKCWDDHPAVRSLLFHYLTADMLRATTSPVPDISEHETAVRTYTEYLEVIPAWTDLAMCMYGRSCPKVVVQAILHINILRLTAQSPAISQPSQWSFQEILQLINNFNVNKWAVSILQIGHTLPATKENTSSFADINALASLAQCFKCATLLYLFLSCTSSITPNSRATITSAIQTLSEQVHILLEVGEKDIDGPLYTQVWRKLGWALLIPAYVRLGWDLGDDGKEYDRLLQKALSLGSDGLLADAKVRGESNEHIVPDRSRLRTWDDGFPWRCFFAQ